MNEHPNYLFVICDQLRSDWLGCYGHPVVKTPHIDALAARGALATDFHVASPVCMPNRASLMTGRMPSVHGLRYNGCTLPTSANTFVDVLAAAGYSTASIGKSHLQPFTSNPPVHTDVAEGRLIEEAWKGDGSDYGLEQAENYGQQQRFDFPVPYYGFQHVDMVTSHGDRCDGHYQQWFRENCPDWEAMHDPANELPHNYSCPQAYRTPIPEEYYSTAWIGDRAIDYLGARASTNPDDPFFAFVSFPDPHHPFNPPGRYWDMYSPDQFSVDLPYSAHQNPTPPMQYLQELKRSGQGQFTPQTAFCADDVQIRQAMALTAGMITMIDDQVGRMVEALKANGQYDNTVIVFTSDHGDYLGDFNLVLKGSMPFRSITQVPMIWSDPRSRSASEFNDLASTIDLPASILARSTLVPYNGMQGKSFVDSMLSAASDGATGAAHRDELLIEYNDGLPRLGFERPPRVRSLRTKAWRLTIYLDQDWGELYDLREDPHETNNLWHDHQYLDNKAEMMQRLANQLTAQMDGSPLSTRLA